MPPTLVKRHNINMWLHHLTSKRLNGGFNGEANGVTNRIKCEGSQSFTQQSQVCIFAESFQQLLLILSGLLGQFFLVCQ